MSSTDWFNGQFGKKRDPLAKVEAKPKTKPEMIPPLVRAGYEQIRKQATKDEFEPALYIYDTLCKQFPESRDRHESVLTGAFEAYTTLQRRIAWAFGSLGDYDRAHKHLKEAASGFWLDGNKKLVPEITQREYDNTRRHIFNHTPAEFFARRLWETAESGEIDFWDYQSTCRVPNLTFEKYMQPLVLAFERDGLVGNDYIKERSISHLELLERINLLHRQAYLTAMRNTWGEKLEKHPLVSPFPIGSKVLTQREQKYRDLLFEYAHLFTDHLRD
ncbi:hypothetical protein COV20_01640 [Candidatus Woesearchaeota archaeon CG10_big_fil_rev_8_21_14_0_10_45_16]|nr:MAG: hypothetical protein COV20_01640 [Candidatus Woesearchaeota archaeon CG10_big_fil_rev_8_21_14_0_10_45_16]